ncbi:MAG: hypothetical protein ACP5IT_10895, partial [Thermoproteota archaeon]
HKVIIIDGPPASGKTTLVKFLKHSYNGISYSYKRLGFANILMKMLMKIVPSIGKGMDYDHMRDDPVVIVDIYFLRKISFIIFLSEIMYKFIQYVTIVLLSLISKIVIVDEGPSLGWANYLNLFFYLKCLSSSSVALLMRLDVQALRLLFKLCNVQLYFVDRTQDELNIFWHKRGHKVPYNIKFASIVRYSFKLLTEEYKNILTFPILYRKLPTTKFSKVKIL